MLSSTPEIVGHSRPPLSYMSYCRLKVERPQSVEVHRNMNRSEATQHTGPRSPPPRPGASRSTKTGAYRMPHRSQLHYLPIVVRPVHRLLPQTVNMRSVMMRCLRSAAPRNLIYKEPVVFDSRNCRHVPEPTSIQEAQRAIQSRDAQCGKGPHLLLTLSPPLTLRL